jgi:hypothetical protein
VSPPRTKGRSLSGTENVRPPPPSAPVSGPVPGPGSPFARYGPGATTMVEAGEENRRQSMGVFAIVGGLVFAVVSALVVAVVVLLSWLAIRQSGIVEEIAIGDTDDDRHIRDGNSAAPLPPEPEPTGGRGTKTPNGADPNVRDPSLGPPPGPVTMIVPSSMMFLSMEVVCPGGLRKRGTFRKDSDSAMRATVPDVPSDVRCTVTFKGSEPAKAWATGGQTQTCTFNPVVCHTVR